MTQKKAYIAGVGEVVMARSTRARRINLCVKPFQGVRVTVPVGVSYASALAVARSKSEWLKKHLGRMAVKEQEALACRPFSAVCAVDDATDYLVRRTRDLAARHGFAINKVFVRRQKTRWGSCSWKNNINLNIRMAHLPGVLIDYVILHELTHTRVRNHSPQFWDELEKVIPAPKLLDRELDRYWMLLVELAACVRQEPPGVGGP